MNYLFSHINLFPVWILLLLSAASNIVGDFFAKFWSTNHRHTYFTAAILSFLCSGVFYAFTLLREQLIVASMIWSILSIMGFLFIGLFIFHEELSSVQTVGVGLGVASLVVLAVAK